MSNKDNAFAIAVAAVVAAVAAAFVVAAVAAVAAAFVAAVVAAVAAAFVVAAAVAAEDNNYKKSYILTSISFLLSIISFCITFRANLNLNILLDWKILILVLVLMEIYFLLDKEKPNELKSYYKKYPKEKNKDLLIFTIKRKFVGLFYSICSISGLWIVYNIYLLLKDYFNEILKWIGYIGAGAIALAIVTAIVYVYIKLNSLKFKR